MSNSHRKLWWEVRKHDQRWLKTKTATQKSKKEKLLIFYLLISLLILGVMHDIKFQPLRDGLQFFPPHFWVGWRPDLHLICQKPKWLGRLWMMQCVIWKYGLGLDVHKREMLTGPVRITAVLWREMRGKKYITVPPAMLVLAIVMFIWVKFNVFFGAARVTYVGLVLGWNLDLGK